MRPERAARRALPILARALTEAVRSAGPGAITRAMQDLARQLPRLPPGTADISQVSRDVQGAALERLATAPDPEALRQGFRAGRILLDAEGLPAELRAAVLMDLGNQVHDQTRVSGDVALLDVGLELARQARELADDPGVRDATRAVVLSSLGDILQARYELTGDADALSQALAAHRDALATAGPDHPGRPLFLEDLGKALVRSRQRAGAPALDEAVGVLRDALRATSPHDLKRPYRQFLLGTALVDRFGVGRAAADLDDGIRLLRDAAVGAHAIDRGLYHSNLGAALSVRFEETGDSRALDESVQAHREALRATPSGHWETGARWLNLGVTLKRRFERTDDLAARDEALACFRTALAASPPGHPLRAAASNDLAVGLISRWDTRDGSPGDLGEAIAVLQRAAAELPDDDPRLPGIRRNLSGALASRGRYTRHSDEVERERAAAEAEARPVRPVPPPSQHAEDLDAAVAQARRALAALPPAHPHRVLGLGAVAMALSERFDARGDPADRAGALEALAEAVRSPMAAPGFRATFGQEWGRLAAAAGDWTQASRAYRLAVDAVAGLIPGELPRDDQEHLLMKSSGLASAAAMSVLHAGEDPARAAEVLERARGVLLAQALRADSGQDPADRQRMTEAAREGPLIMLVAGAEGGAALLVTREGVDALLLPELTDAAVAGQVGGLRIALATVGDPRQDGSLRRAAGALLEDLNHWLWDTVAERVLARLGLAGPGPPGARLPRLWWIPTGLVGFLPLHAAGRHAAGGHAAGRHGSADGSSVLDRSVSSYSPTIRALEQIRVRNLAAAPGPRRSLVVAMSRTPGHPDLPGVVAERDLLLRLLPGAAALTDAGATRGAVLSALADSDVVHFACHAASRPDDPSRSHLVLTDGPLAVADLAAVRVRGAAIAYLSACATARGGTRLADEAIHISSAFQLAGYAQVVGTLWPVDDAAALQVASGVYGTGVDRRPGALARSLHAAVRGLRADLGGRSPWRWAAHVHLGA